MNQRPLSSVRKSLAIALVCLLVVSAVGPATGATPLEWDQQTKSDDRPAQTAAGNSAPATAPEIENTSNDQAAPPVPPGAKNRTIDSGLLADTQTGDDQRVRTAGTTMVPVLIRIADGERHGVVQRVQNAGGTVTEVHNGLVQGRMPAAAVTTVAAHDGVEFMQRPPRAVTNDIENEALDDMRATAAHQAGYTGDNVTVTVVDLEGFDLTNPAIADNVNKFHMTDGVSSIGNGTTGEHGTAVAEIVVDTAPNVTLNVVRFRSYPGYLNAIDWIANETQTDVVVASVGWVNAGPLNGTSEMDHAISSRLTSEGVLWVNSAGNYAGGQHWNGTWTDPNDNGWLNFTSGGELTRLETNDMISLYLSWNEWPGTTNDYDLYLFDERSDFPNKDSSVAKSITLQNGAQPPVESVRAISDGASPYYMGIYAPNETAPSQFDAFLFDGKFEAYTDTRSVALPGTSPSVLTVGAFNHAGPRVGSLRPYSSRGPTIDGRQKPDLVAPDGVSLRAYGGGVFRGTSAAAPHVGGVAALALEANRTLQANALRRVLTETARPLEGIEPTNRTGVGFVTASTAVNAVGGNVPIRTISAGVTTHRGDPAVGDSLWVDETKAAAGTTTKAGTGTVTVVGNGTSVLGYQQYRGAGTKAAYGPRDGVPDIYNLGAVNADRTSVSLGTVTLPPAQSLDVRIVDELGEPVPDAPVYIYHRNDSSESYVATPSFETTDTGAISTPASNATGIEVSGAVVVTAGPPTDADRFVDERVQQRLRVNTTTGNRSVTLTLDDPSIVTTRVVNASNDTTYNTIQAAIDDARNGTRIVVSPGVYNETVSVGKNVTVTAHQGAQLNGQGRPTGVVISGAAPTIRNVSITNVTVGVSAGKTNGSWRLENVTIGNEHETGVNATSATGAWEIRNTTIAGSEQTGTIGVAVKNTTGNWTVTDSIISGHEVGIAAGSAGPTPTAVDNFWGAQSGPGGTYDGDGDPVNGSVRVAPFYADRNRSVRSFGAPASLAFASTPANVTPGENLTANLTVTNATSVFSTRGQFSYNASLLNLTDISAGPFLSSGTGEASLTTDHDAANGTVQVTLTRSNTTSAVDGAGTLLQISARATRTAPVNATTTLRPDGLELAMADGTQLLTTVTDDTVRIKQPPELNATIRSGTPTAGAPMRFGVESPGAELSSVTVRVESDYWTGSYNASDPARVTVTPQRGAATWNGTVYKRMAVDVRGVIATGDVGFDRIHTPVYAAGDISGDGRVSIMDASLLGRHWNATRGDTAYDRDIDINNDGRVDIFDVVMIGRHWGTDLTAPE